MALGGDRQTATRNHIHTVVRTPMASTMAQPLARWTLRWPIPKNPHNFTDFPRNLTNLLNRRRQKSCEESAVGGVERVDFLRHGYLQNQ
jgi:hypothetical protein